MVYSHLACGGQFLSLGPRCRLMGDQLMSQSFCPHTGLLDEDLVYVGLHSGEWGWDSDTVIPSDFLHTVHQRQATTLRVYIHTYNSYIILCHDYPKTMEYALSVSLSSLCTSIYHVMKISCL